jgi:hypothetical protein
MIEYNINYLINFLKITIYMLGKKVIKTRILKDKKEIKMNLNIIKNKIKLYYFKKDWISKIIEKSWTIFISKRIVKKCLVILA